MSTTTAPAHIHAAHTRGERYSALSAALDSITRDSVFVAALPDPYASRLRTDLDRREADVWDGIADAATEPDTNW